MARSTPRGASTSLNRRGFMNTGRWAGEQLLKALKAGKHMSPQALRTLDTLRKNEWEHLDEAVIREGIIRLAVAADVRAAGLVIPVPNAMGKTMFQWETATDMEPAQISLSGVSRTEDDRQEFTLNSQPMPIIHKDFNMNLRTLEASRNPPGEPLDTMQAETAARLVAEKIEEGFFLGTNGKTFGGSQIYGLTNHPSINTQDFENNEEWNHASKDGAGILTDVLGAITKLEGDRFYGPYMIYIPTAYSVPLENDFKANSDLTIRQRLLQINGVQGIKVADQCPANQVVIVQMTRDVISLIDGEPIQTIQWDIEGGMILKFKVMAIQHPLIRADVDGRCGVCVIKQL